MLPIIIMPTTAARALSLPLSTQLPSKYPHFALTLHVAQSDRELRQFGHLAQNLLGDEMHAAMLWPQVDLALEPGRAYL